MLGEYKYLPLFLRGMKLSHEIRWAEVDDYRDLAYV
jgi:hypothetical protein